MPGIIPQFPPCNSPEEVIRALQPVLEQLAGDQESGGLGVTVASTADMIAATNNTRVVSPLRFLEGLQQTPWVGGLGTVPRTLPARHSDVLNICDFGAVGDGLDASATVNSNALDAAKAASLAKPFGAEIYVPGGNFVLAREFLIPDSGAQFAKMTLHGAGQFISTLKARASGFSGANIVRSLGQTDVSDLRLHCNGLAVNGLTMQGTPLQLPCTVARVSVILSLAVGIVTSGVTVQMSHCVVGGCARGVDSSGDGDGVMMDKCYVSNVAANNWCVRWGGTGPEGFVMRDTILVPNFAPATQGRGLFVQAGGEMTIDTCVIEGAGASTGSSVEIWNASWMRIVNSWLGSGLRVNGACSGLHIGACTFPNGSPIIITPLPGPLGGGNPAAGRSFVNVIGNFFHGDCSLAQRFVFDQVSRGILMSNHVFGNNRGIFTNAIPDSLWVVFNGIPQSQSASSDGFANVTFGLNY